MKKKISRRDFMIQGSGAVIGAGFAFKSGRPGSRPAVESRVIEVSHPGAVPRGREIDPAVTKQMLKAGMEGLTGSKQPWAHFIKPEDRVGLKINTLGRPLLYTHHELIQAVSEELLAFGVKPENIIVWDRFETHMADCDFSFNTSGEGITCYGTEALETDNNRFDPEFVYESSRDRADRRAEGRTASYLSRIFTRECDKVINLAILKDHGLAGVTLTLKNLAYGLCDNNRRFHGPECIGPFISEFCALPIVRNKVVLHMIDGLEACYDQGPRPQNPRVIYPQNTLWLGTDPVALDAVGYRVINAKRRAEGVPSLEETGRPLDHISLAAKLGVGIDDPGKIRRIKIELGG